MDLTRFDVDLDGLTDEEIRQRVLTLHAEKSRLDGELIAAIDVFDRRQLHATDAARSSAGWMTARVDQTKARNAADVNLARDLRTMPVVAAAFRSGRLGRAKVDLLVKARTPEVAEVFADQEDWLVGQVADLRVCDASRFLRAWHEQARFFVGSIDPDEPVTETAPRIAVRLAQTFDGRFVLDAEMDAEHGLILRGTLDAEVDHMFRTGVFRSDDGLTPAERRGQALVQILVRKGHSGEKHDAPRPLVEVICDEKTLQGLPIEDDEDLQSRVCAYGDGTPLPLTTLSRLLCGADIHRIVVNAKGEVLDLGKTTRLANRSQRRALMFRHGRHCAFPGCDAPADWCEAHHVAHWNPDPDNPDGGTDIINLVPLCRYHHHRVHEGGFLLILKPDGTVDAHRPPDHHGRRCPITPARTWRRPRTATG